MTEQNFELLKFGILKRVGDELIRPNVQVERILDDWQIVVTGRLMGQDSIQRHEIKYPADWWQAFKERWFPAWLLSRYPVEYTVEVIDIAAIYPELHKRLHLPDEPHFYSPTRYKL